MAMMLMTTTWGGWQTCYRLANTHVDLIVTGDVGPRVIALRQPGGANVFYTDAALLGKTGGEAWVNYGGHRLWHAPEVQPRTYAPDNAPVAVEATELGARFIQPVEATTGIQKEIELALDPERARVRVIHRLRNTALWAVELAPWALSVMAPGGKAIMPLPPRGSHAGNLLPTGRVVLWAYTDLRDARWTWGTRHVLLQQQSGNPVAQKAGFWVPDGWAAYVNGGVLFVKTFAAQAGAVYPDQGSNVELFTNADILEVETLGPLACVAPGQMVEHIEEWSLFDGVPVPEDDAAVAAHILPRVREALAG